MSGVNKVFLIGHLGKDPEYRHMEGGVMVAKFPLATTEYYKTKEGQRQEQTEWHNIVLWRQLAEAAERLHLNKGSQICIEGKIRSRSWEKDGIKRYSTEIVAENMTLLNLKKQQEQTARTNNTEEDAAPVSDMGGDLPF